MTGGSEVLVLVLVPGMAARRGRASACRPAVLCAACATESLPRLTVLCSGAGGRAPLQAQLAAGHRRCLWETQWPSS
jgi:hypothetical protein